MKPKFKSKPILAPKKFAPNTDLSEGHWTEITLTEAATCLVCHHLLEPGENVKMSPGRWLRHPSCVWAGPDKYILLQ